MNLPSHEQMSQIIAAANAPDTVISLGNVVGTSGAIVALALGLWQVIVHIKRNNTVSGAEEKLYGNLGNENDRLVVRLKHLEDSRDECKLQLDIVMSEITGLRTQVLQVSVLETDNAHLRERLNEKDLDIERKNEQLQVMMSSLMAKNDHILQLTERVHQLELRLSADEQKFCMDCPRLVGAVGG